MTPVPQRVRKLRLEWLESRTLLAGLGFEDALAKVAPAVSGSGDFTLAFSARIGESELFVTGSSAGSMTIDFDLLPSFITAVTIKNFSTVTFTGTDVLSKLVASDIKTLDADQITVGVGLYVNNVETVSLATGGSLAVLNGASTKLDIADLENTLIISDLQKLSINSSSPHISIVSLNSAQSVSVLYPADQVSVSGLSDSASQVLFVPIGETPAENPNGSGNVVTVTPNEQTSILIARIREALRAGGSVNPLSVLDSAAQPDSGLTPTSITISARSEAHLNRVTISAPVAASTLPADVSHESVPTLGEIELQAIDWAVAGAQTSAANFDSGLVQSEFGAPDFFATLPIDELALGADDFSTHEALVTREAQESFLENLRIDSRTLRDVVIEGIVGEITPGERTAFLLVDPKPSRSSNERNRESSLQEIA